MAGEPNQVLAALQPGACLTVDHLAQATGLENRLVVKAAAVLIGRGLANRAEVGCFTITHDGEVFRNAGKTVKCGPKGKNTGTYRRHKKVTMQDRLWAALRMRGKASIPELLELAADPTKPGTGYSNAQRYLAALAKAGFLRELPRAAGTSVTSNGFKRYALVINPGPSAPQVRPKKREVYDPNERKTYSFGGGR